MFPIDPSKLPTLKTRRGLLIVDPQNDFLAKDGALAVQQTEDLPQRIADLVTSFRQNGGDIIWVHSKFQASRSTHDERILTSDQPVLTGPSAATRGRRSRAHQQGPDEPSKCPEAFLGPPAPTRPECVRPGTTGIEVHPTVQKTVLSKDHVVMKSHYSAFQSEQLLPFLRKRLVTELFICGSLTNIGVMATAVDAAQHGYDITVVEDCCGYRSPELHNDALKQIREATGCDVLATENALRVLQPRTGPSQSIAQKKLTSSAGAAADGIKSSSVRQRAGEGDATSSTAALESSLEKLSLNSEPVVHDKPKHAVGTPATSCLEEKQVQSGVGSSNEKTGGKETGTTTSDSAAARSDSPNADAPLPPKASPPAPAPAPEDSS